MLIPKLLTSILKAIKVDYVVEQGTSGNWTYRKWNSGKAECFGKGTASSTFTFSAYGGYRGSAITLTLPTGVFLDVVSINISLNTANTGFALISAYDNSKIVYYPYNRTNLSSQSSFSWFANIIGRWK